MFYHDVLSYTGVSLNEIQVNQFKVYYEFLIKYNKHTNLTRITEEKEVYYKHFLDSLLLTKSCDIKKIHTMCDMGSGAGFPSIPLKIVYPHLKITIVDALQKRISFLSELVEKLNLDDVTLVHDRAELFAKKNQEAFDLVTARALGSLKLISEMGIPMVNKEGIFVGLKSAKYEEEMKEATPILKILASVIDKVDTFELPYDYGTRVNIIIKKERHVLGYPRTFAQMKK